MSLWDFAGRSRDLGNALVLSDALRLGPPRGAFEPLTQPYAARVGVRGVGIVRHNEALVPIVLVVGLFGPLGPSPGEPGVPLIPLPQVQRVLTVVREAFAGEQHDWWNRCMVRVISEPQLQTAPGDVALCAGRGTLGSHISWSGGDGILTAGHVGQPRGGTVTDPSGGTVGTVAFESDPAGNGTTAMADVAVVKLPSAASSTITGTAKVGASDPIHIWTARGVLTDNVMGMASWIYFPNVTGTSADVYFTYNGVTIPGDSGSAVVRQGTTQVIGHVIGGSGTFTSYIQDVDYQLTQIRAYSPLAGATI